MNDQTISQKLTQAFSPPEPEPVEPSTDEQLTATNETDARLDAMTKYGIPLEHADLLHGTTQEVIEASAAKVSTLLAKQKTTLQPSIPSLPETIFDKLLTAYNTKDI